MNIEKISVNQGVFTFYDKLAKSLKRWIYCNFWPFFRGGQKVPILVKMGGSRGGPNWTFEGQVWPPKNGLFPHRPTEIAKNGTFFPIFLAPTWLRKGLFALERVFLTSVLGPFFGFSILDRFLTLFVLDWKSGGFFQFWPLLANFDHF